MSSILHCTQLFKHHAGVQLHHRLTPVQGKTAGRGVFPNQCPSVQGTEWNGAFAFCPPVQAETMELRSSSKCNRFSLYSGQISVVQAAQPKCPIQRKDSLR